MYDQIIRFLIIIFIYSAQPENIKHPISIWSGFVLCIVQFAVFYAVCRVFFIRKERLTQVSPKDYEKTENFLSLLIIPFYAFLVYGINIKYLISFSSILSRSVTVSNFIGLALYFFYLGIVWYSGYPLLYRISDGSMTIRNHIESKIRFYTGMILPWLALSMLYDAAEHFIRWNFLKTDEGHILIIICGFVGFSVFGIDLVVKTWQCKPLPRGERRNTIEKFLTLHHFPVKDLLLWTSFGEKALTAGIIGFIPKARYILITPALNEVLDDDEMLAVIAHEMGHIRKFHIPFYLALFIGYIFIVYAISDLAIIWMLNRDTFASLASDPGVLSTTMLSVLTTLPFLIFLILYFRFIFGYFSRNCERQADLYALELLGTPIPFISALRKIAILSGYPLSKSNWHHYGIIERIEFISDASLDSAVGVAHNRKLSSSIKIWFVSVVLIVTCGFLIRKSSWFDQAMINANLKIVAASVNQSINDPLFYVGYAGYLMEKESYAYAEKVLLKGLEQFKNNPELLNALAWLYATAPQPLRRPDRAIELAEKAVRLSPESPHIWDTLAEAYYSRGFYDKALNAINKALSLDPSPKDYYIRQREKIQKHIVE